MWNAAGGQTTSSLAVPNTMTRDLRCESLRSQSLLRCHNPRCHNLRPRLMAVGGLLPLDTAACRIPLHADGLPLHACGLPLCPHRLPLYQSIPPFAIETGDVADFRPDFRPAATTYLPRGTARLTAGPDGTKTRFPKWNPPTRQAQGIPPLEPSASSLPGSMAAATGPVAPRKPHRQRPLRP